jgi:hypothetical protein
VKIKTTILLSAVIFFAVTASVHSQSKINFKFSGGGTNIDTGDINDTINELRKRYTDFNSFGYTASFAHDGLSWMLDLSGELIIKFTKNFGIGIGSGYLGRERKGTGILSFDQTQSLWWGTRDISITDQTQYSYKLDVIPVTFNVYCFVVPNKTISLFLNVGTGYYFGKGELTEDNDYSSRQFNNSAYFSDESYEKSWNGIIKEKIDAAALGFQGGIGIELNFTRNFGLVAEVGGRLVNFKNWQGTYKDSWSWNDSYWVENEGTVTNSDSGEGSQSGKLWRFTFQSSRTGNSYSTIAVRSNEPDSAEREAEININGYSFKIGFVIKL